MKFLGNSAEFVPGAEIWLDRFFRRRTPPTPLPSKVVAVGHRGTKTHAPENTIAAHETAYKLGARCIEFDVRCTKDGHFVVFHDRDVARTTNGSGDVADMTLTEIQSLDAGRHKDPRFEGEIVPSLREALSNVRGRFAVDIDFKGGPKNSAPMIKEILDETGFGAYDAPLVTIFARIKDFEKLISLSHHYALRPHYLGRRHARRMAQEFNIDVYLRGHCLFKQIISINWCLILTVRINLRPVYWVEISGQS